MPLPAFLVPLVMPLNRKYQNINSKATAMYQYLVKNVPNAFVIPNVGARNMRAMSAMNPGNNFIGFLSLCLNTPLIS